MEEPEHRRLNRQNRLGFDLAVFRANRVKDGFRKAVECRFLVGFTSLRRKSHDLPAFLPRLA